MRVNKEGDFDGPMSPMTLSFPLCVVLSQRLNLSLHFKQNFCAIFLKSGMISIIFLSYPAMIMQCILFVIHFHLKSCSKQK